MIAGAKTRSRAADAALLVTLAVAITALVILAVAHVAPLRQAARWLDDLRLAYLAPLAAQSPAVAVLAIDEDTMRRLEYRSPVDRAFLADLVRQLAANERVAAIGIDMIFDQPTSPAADAALRRALLESAVPVVVATGEAATGLDRAQLAFQEDFLSGVGTGSAMLVVEGGVVRKHFPRSPVTGMPTFAQALAEAAGIAGMADAAATDDMADVTGHGGAAAPLPVYFRRAATDNASPIRVYPAHSAALLPPDWLAGRVVLLGVDLPDRDQHRTPLSVLGAPHEYMAGVLVHAQVLAQLASGAQVPALAAPAANAIVLLAVIAGLWLVLAPIPPALRIGTALLAAAGWWVAGFTPAVYQAAALPLVAPTLGFAVAGAAATAVARQRERRKRLFLHGAFNQYVSPQIIDDILQNPAHLQLGGELREMSFIFTDIAGFSSLAERLTPGEVVDLLTDYLDGVVEIALGHRGTIARFAGDALVIFFGAPLEDAEHRRNALDCGLAIDRFCEAYRLSERIRAHGLGETRIGVHAGTAVVGNIGGRRRFEYTAHGDVVNTAARLESANRHFGTRVCFSETLLDEVGNHAHRPIGDVILKGRSTPVRLYTAWESTDVAWREACLHAFDLLRREDPAALQAWEALAARMPADGLVRFHLRRLQAGDTGPVIRMDDK